MDKLSKKIKEKFGDKIISSDTAKAAKAAFVCRRFRKILREFFEPDFMKNIKITSFKNGVIYISIKNNFYSQEIKLKEGELIKKANQELEDDLVKKILFKSK